MVKLKSGTIEILKSLRITERESYDEVINRVLIQKIAERELELNNETKKIVADRLKKLNEGRVKSFEEILKLFEEKKGTSRDNGIHEEVSETRGDDDVLEV